MADNDVLVITGGARGMGLACARALAGRGHLLLVDVRTDEIAALAAFLESDGAAFISGCDIRVDGGLVGAARDLLGGG
jgi:NAD(P)-dependent dehydrogenase (short-subunit alcohol dehydrogenase family)